MTAYLVSPFYDVFDDTGVLFGVAPHQKKCCRNLQLFEHVQTRRCEIGMGTVVEGEDNTITISSITCYKVPIGNDRVDQVFELLLRAHGDSLPAPATGDMPGHDVRDSLHFVFPRFLRHCGGTPSGRVE